MLYSKAKNITDSLNFLIYKIMNSWDYLQHKHYDLLFHTSHSQI